MTDTSSHPRSMTAAPYITSPRTATPRISDPQREADAPFLRRVLFGLIAATVFSGAVTLALTAQNDLVESRQVASTHGPA